MQIVVGVSFKKAGKIYYFDPSDIELRSGDRVVVETSRGIEMGEVIINPKEVEDDQIVQPLKKVIRKATPKDLEQMEINQQKEKEAYTICLEKIFNHGLPMKLVDVEYTFDNNKIIFYFTADGRVDFRELVKDLASVFRTRIELRQIGVRDEAKMIGGLGPCGLELCCKTFLREFEPISIKMAKSQELSLNPTKISGICGRLMCCLRYESDTYDDEPIEDEIIPEELLDEEVLTDEYERYIGLARKQAKPKIYEDETAEGENRVVEHADRNNGTEPGKHNSRGRNQNQGRPGKPGQHQSGPNRPGKPAENNQATAPETAVTAGMGQADGKAHGATPVVEPTSRPAGEVTPATDVTPVEPSLKTVEHLAVEPVVDISAGNESLPERPVVVAPEATQHSGDTVHTITDKLDCERGTDNLSGEAVVGNLALSIDLQVEKETQANGEDAANSVEGGGAATSEQYEDRGKKPFYNRNKYNRNFKNNHNNNNYQRNNNRNNFGNNESGDASGNSATENPKGTEDNQGNLNNQNHFNKNRYGNNYQNNNYRNNYNRGGYNNSANNTANSSSDANSTNSSSNSSNDHQSGNNYPRNNYHRNRYNNERNGQQGGGYNNRANSDQQGGGYNNRANNSDQQGNGSNNANNGQAGGSYNHRTGNSYNNRNNYHRRSDHNNGENQSTNANPPQASSQDAGNSQNTGGHHGNSYNKYNNHSNGDNKPRYNNGNRGYNNNNNNNSNNTGNNNNFSNRKPKDDSDKNN